MKAQKTQKQPHLLKRILLIVIVIIAIPLLAYAGMWIYANYIYDEADEFPVAVVEHTQINNNILTVQVWNKGVRGPVKCRIKLMRNGKLEHIEIKEMSISHNQAVLFQWNTERLPEFDYYLADAIVDTYTLRKQK